MFDSLTLDSFYYSYNKDRTIINGIYAKWNVNEIVGILGKNGSGKSTLFNAITINNDYQGSLSVNNEIKNRKQLNKLIAYLPQKNFLPNELKVKQVLSLFKMLNVKEVSADDRINKLFNIKINDLSGGEKRYIEFMLINNINKPIVILDEPFSEIDPIYEEKICNYILKNQKNRLYLITDHKNEILKKICTKFEYLANGKLVPILNKDSLVKNGYLVKI